MRLVSVPNKLIVYTETVLWTGVSTHNMSVFVTMSTHRPLPLFTGGVFLYFKFEYLSFVKINVTEKVFSCSLFWNKETKDYVTSPRVWTCDILPLFSFILLWFTSRSPKCGHAGSYVYDDKIFGKERERVIIHGIIECTVTSVRSLL